MRILVSIHLDMGVTDMVENSLEIKDRLGNLLKVGDIVLVLVPHTYGSFRKATIRKLRYVSYADVCVEYDDGRLYSDIDYFDIREGVQFKFRSKPVKAWRCSSEIVKFDPKYFE